jgi:hypothetical protein
VILHPLRLLPTHSLTKSNLQIRPSAKYPSIARHDDALDLRINVEHGICLLNLSSHGICEGIVLARAIECEDDDARFCFVVRGAYACPLFVEVVVAVWEDDVRHVPWGDLTR